MYRPWFIVSKVMRKLYLMSLTILQETQTDGCQDFRQYIDTSTNLLQYSHKELNKQLMSNCLAIELLSRHLVEK